MIQAANESIKNTEDDLKNFQKNKSGNLDKLVSEINKLSKELKVKEQDCDTATELVEELTIDKERLFEEIEADEAQIKSLDSFIEETNNNISSANNAIMEFKEEIDLLKQQSLDNSLENEIIENEFRKLTSLLTAKKNEIEKMPVLIKEIQEAIDDIYESNRILDEKLDKLVTEFEWLETD